MANNLWEQSSIGADCERCGIDAPFFIPAYRTDMMALRFQVPYYLVNANGGGLPVGSNVRLKIVDQTGTTTLCDLGPLNGGKFVWTRYNDSTTKKAEYQFYFPIGMANELGQTYSHKYVDVNEGQYLEISGSGTDADGGFTYGVDATPAIFQEIKAGRLVFPFITPGIGLSVTLDGVAVSAPNVYSSITQCPHENYDCWRVMLSINFSISGVTKEFYTKPFKIERGCDSALRITGQYPGGTTDCNGYVHQGIMTPAIGDLNRLFIRIPADLNRGANKVKKTYNNKCFSIKGERIPIYQLNSEPMPEWMVDEVENIMLAKDTQYDNLPLMLTDTDSIFSTQDAPGFQYQNIDISLQSCKCLTIYSC